MCELITMHGGKQFLTDAKNTVEWGSDGAKTTHISLKQKLFKMFFIEISIAIQLGIFLSETLKKERQPLLEKLKNSLPLAEVF